MRHCGVLEWRLLFTSLTGHPPPAEKEEPGLWQHEPMVALLEAGSFLARTATFIS